MDNIIPDVFTPRVLFDQVEGKKPSIILDLFSRAINRAINVVTPKRSIHKYKYLDPKVATVLGSVINELDQQTIELQSIIKKTSQKKTSTSKVEGVVSTSSPIFQYGLIILEKAPTWPAQLLVSVSLTIGAVAWIAAVIKGGWDVYVEEKKLDLAERWERKIEKAFPESPEIKKFQENVKELIENRQSLPAPAVMAPKHKLQLKAILRKKVEIKKDFIKFNLNSKKFVLVITGIGMAVFITLKILLAASAVGATAGITLALTSTGIGFFAIGAILLIVGLVYLYRKQPHLFSLYRKGVQAKLTLIQIPLFFQELRLKIVKANMLRTIEKTQKWLQKQTTTQFLDDKRLSHDAETNKRYPHLSKIMDKIDSLNKNAEALKNRIAEAKRRDMERSLSLTEQEQFELDEMFTAFAVAMLSPGEHEQTLQFLEENLGLNFTKLREIYKGKLEYKKPKAINQVKEALQAFVF